MEPTEQSPHVQLTETILAKLVAAGTRRIPIYEDEFASTFKDRFVDYPIAFEDTVLRLQSDGIITVGQTSGGPNDENEYLDVCLTAKGHAKMTSRGGKDENKKSKLLNESTGNFAGGFVGAVIKTLGGG